MNAPDKAPVIRSRDWSGRALALISLAVALAGFSYNTWRNETTEAHRNVRQASFQMLNEIGQLQQIVDNRYYANDHSEMTRIAGWGKAALLRDLGPLVSPTTAQRSQEAFDAWSANAEGIDAHDAESERRVSGSLKRLRKQVLDELMALR
jgi:hypothetical protein